ncbi:MAG: LLM class flavin-dependent oxidoreductase [Hyphomicrobiales bacterium]|nr:LLM class flavin-dependent oxidoreductase [Hyphomicrobiales bacterium]
MPVGVFFDGFSSTAEMLEVCREAEASGASSLWFAQHMGYRDALIWATAAAAVTQRAALVPTAISPYLWPPLPVAMAIATLDELAPGRVILNVSVGNILNLGESGVTPEKPIRVMRDYVGALRALWNGQPVTRESQLHTLRGAKMVFAQGRQYPIYIASTGPQMLELAGEIADGVLLSAGLTLTATLRCLDRAQDGVVAKRRDPAALRKCSFINCNVSADGAVAKAAMLRKLAFLFRSRGHAENIKSSNLDIDHDAIIAAHARHDFDGAVRLMPPQAANVFGAAGTPSECRARLEQYLAIGLDEPIIEVSGNAEERRLALDVVRDLAQR